MRFLSSLHDPKKDKYALYYSIILSIVIITVILLLTGTLDISPIEGGAMFFEGFVALFMLTRHKKVSHSFSNQVTQLRANLKKHSNPISRINFRKN